MKLFDMLVSSNVTTGYKKTALSPILWLFGAIAAAIVPIIIKVEDREIRMFSLIFLMSLSVLLVLVCIILLFKNPSLLQSEKYQIENKKLDIIASKTNGFVKVEEELFDEKIDLIEPRNKKDDE